MNDFDGCSLSWFCYTSLWLLLVVMLGCFDAFCIVYLILRVLNLRNVLLNAYLGV